MGCASRLGMPHLRLNPKGVCVPYHQQLNSVRRWIQTRFASPDLPVDGSSIVESILLKEGFAVGHRFKQEDVVADFDATTEEIVVSVAGQVVQTIASSALEERRRAA